MTPDLSLSGVFLLGYDLVASKDRGAPITTVHLLSYAFTVGAIATNESNPPGRISALQVPIPTWELGTIQRVSIVELIQDRKVSLFDRAAVDRSNSLTFTVGLLRYHWELL